MPSLAEQLERVRGRARTLLIVQRCCQWLAAVLVAALVLALVDYALRLPEWLRLVIGFSALGLSGQWLGARLRAAAAFRPTLDQLALRLERIYPQLTGQLATAVEFSASPERYAEPASSGALVRASLERALERARQIDVGRVLDRSRTGRAALAAGLAAVVVGGLAAAMPDHAIIAAQRYFAPFSGVEWPRRQHVVPVEAAAVWPADTPLLLAAQVERGHRAGMRVELHYRLVTKHQTGRETSIGWQRALMSEQATPGRYERQVDLPESVTRELESGASGAGVTTLEYYVAAGDDQSAPRTLAVVPRPAVTRVSLALTPPAYAQPYLTPSAIDLQAQDGPLAVASGFVGSTVRMTIGFNKPITPGDITDLLPGVPEDDHDSAGIAIEATGEELVLVWTLTDSIESPIRVADAHGLTNLSEKRYRIEAIRDKPVAVSLTKPVADEAVLATATVAIEAVAQDDVAVRGVALEAAIERADGPTPASSDALRLSDVEGGRADVSTSHVLDLAQTVPQGGDTALQPGDVVVITAIADDVFELDGVRHDSTRSTPRRLRIVDATAMVGQLRSELANVRQQTIRLESAQQALVDQALPTGEEGETREGRERFARAAARQAELARRIAAQAQVVQNLRERATRNRLDEPAMLELLRQAGGLLDEAAQAGEAAGAKLRDAGENPEPAKADEARARQAEADAKLEDLVSLLDQGGDALSLQVTLRQLQAAQQNLAEEARALFPETVGQSLESLPAETRQRLEGLGQKQAELAEQARAAVQQMQEAAQQLRQQAAEGGTGEGEENPDRDRQEATAEALAEAAAIAQRQGLQQNMRQSSQSMGQNQLAQAGQQQNQALSTLEQMLEEMGTQQQRMMARLRRRLQELAQAIERLLQRQQAEVTALDRVVADAELSGLEPEQANLRRSTIATEEQAKATEGAEATASALTQAVTAQGQAVLALRGAQRMPAKEAEAVAVTALEQALAAVRAMEQQAAEAQAKEERAKLRERYEALAGRQDALAERVTTALGDREAGPGSGLNRQQRAAVMPLSREQGELRTEAAALGEEAAEGGGATVFERLHERLDRSLGGIGDRLARGEADAALLRGQAEAAATLRRMAAALEEAGEEQPFAGETGSEGGGGGSGGGDSKAVPPAAELRLLRGMQEAIYEATRAVHEGGVAATEAQARLREIGAEQREAAELGREMVRQLQQFGEQSEMEPQPQE